MKRVTPLIFILLLTLTGCNNEKTIVEERHVFPENNWNHENRLVTYNVKIDGMPNPCKVILELDHAHKTDLVIPITVSIKSPDGGTTSRRVSFVIDKNHQADPNCAVAEVYPQKYFNVAGDYEFTILRKWDKYDFPANKALTLKVLKMPVE
ncbi:hypothetical protein LJC53_03760 [Bacteroidales bacterium OttesenSCG-928-C03]|nr:hypothetical protein [Bacteroidales bacterium OttesenSCG-928-E04]MDL2308683.1 hypothetical protein [Bacteroidales bacterium OttesenSCG-928-C03]MDL2325955.1 hypothetical protein [Bacteroidales bacterium OttesenSCG-928-A14]